MRKIASFFLCILVFVNSSALATSTMTFVSDYSVAEKMWKQLTAGSGLKATGTLRTSSAGDVTDPVDCTLKAIYVRPDDNGNGAEIHADATMGDALYQLKQVDDIWYAHADALGEEWVSFENFFTDQLSLLPLPGFLYASLPALLTEQTIDPRYQQLLEEMLIQIDFWLETYRDTAEMGKDDDGVSHIVMKYTITKEEIKAQVKQLLTSLFDDTKTLSLLQSFLTKEQATQFLNPHLQAFYGQAIDALPLTTDLFIERTVNLAGETTALTVRLPLCDMQGDPIAFYYEGTKKEADMLHLVTVDSEQRHLEMQFQTETIDETLFLNAKVASVDASGEGLLPNLSFVFQSEISDVSKTNDNSEDMNIKQMKITLGKDPDWDENIPNLLEIPSLEVTALLTFTSKPLTNASTHLLGELVMKELETEKTSTLTFEAETTIKWTP